MYCIYYATDRINRNLTFGKMRQRKKQIQILLFRNLAPQIHQSEREERTEEVEDDRIPALHSELQADLRQRLMKSELATLDAVITSHPRRATQFAEILVKSSLQTVNTQRKRNARKHIEDNIDITGVALNEEHQPIIVLKNISGDTITDLVNTIETFPQNTNLLIVLDKDNLQSLARQLLKDKELELDLDFGQGIKITLKSHMEKIK